ncbi:MAG: tetratricopeptide repeat protein [Chloroflexota bacterium]
MSRFFHRDNFFALLVALTLTGGGCAPQRPYRPVYPRNDVPPASRIPSPAPAPVYPPTSQDRAREQLPQDQKIREQDLKSEASPPYSAARESKEPARQARAGEAPAVPEPSSPPLPDDSSLLAKITPGVTPQRAASLRLTDEGSKLLDAGEPAKALARLERTIVVDSTNPYGYYYLAKAQFRLGHYRESLNFLDVAQARLGGEPFWLAEVHALRGENYRALGQSQRAEESYLQALKINSGNRTAADGLSRLQGESPSAAR